MSQMQVGMLSIGIGINQSQTHCRCAFTTSSTMDLSTGIASGMHVPMPVMMVHRMALPTFFLSTEKK
jgi:hypothetical protein